MKGSEETFLPPSTENFKHIYICASVTNDLSMKLARYVERWAVCSNRLANV